MTRTDGFNFKSIAKIITLIMFLIIGFSMSYTVGETVGAGEIVIMEDLIDGEIHVWNQPGFYFQKFGRITRYKKSDQYWFSARSDEGQTIDQSISVRFNDGGHASISGSLRYDLPVTDAQMIKLHSMYGSQDAIEKSLLRSVVNKSVYMTGPLLSSKQSYAEGRNDLISYIADQITNGVYKTNQIEQKVQDALSGHEKTITIVKLIQDPKAPGGFLRQEDSAILEFGIRVSNISITRVDYSPEVEAQIKQQQNAIMEVQTAIAHAKKAEQAAITAAKEGEASAAKAKWAEEVNKARDVTQAEKEAEVAKLVAEREKQKAVTEAQRHRDVAKLKMEAADFTRREQILLGQGEAARKAAAASANNSLELRLAAWQEVNKAYADALGKQQQVPHILIGGPSGSQNVMQSLIQTFMAKTASELNIPATPRN